MEMGGSVVSSRESTESDLFVTPTNSAMMAEAEEVPAVVSGDAAEMNNRKPRLFGLIGMEKVMRMRARTSAYVIAALEIGVHVAAAVFFLWEYFAVSHPQSTRLALVLSQANNSSAVPSHHHRSGDQSRHWGILYCPSTNSSIIQTVASCLTIVLAFLLIFSRKKRNHLLLRVWMVLMLVMVVGRVTLAGVQFRCCSNIILLPWILDELFFLEVVRFYHWELKTEFEKSSSEFHTFTSDATLHTAPSSFPELQIEDSETSHTTNPSQH